MLKLQILLFFVVFFKQALGYQIQQKIDKVQ